MQYYHVIAKVGSDEVYRELFSDLTVSELIEQFVKPYENGTKFFSGHDLILPDDLSFVQIVATEKDSKTERADMNRRDLQKIDEFNRSDAGGFIVSAGIGYDPEDIAETGVDVTRDFVKGPPGYRANRWSAPKNVLAWVAGILATVSAAGLINWLGWI